MQRKIQTTETYPMCDRRKTEFVCSMCLLGRTMNYHDADCVDCDNDNETRYKICPCCHTCKILIKDEVTCTDSKDCLLVHEGRPCDGKSAECDNKHNNSKASRNDSDEEFDGRNKSNTQHEGKTRNLDNIETNRNCYCKLKDRNSGEKNRHEMNHLNTKKLNNDRRVSLDQAQTERQYDEEYIRKNDKDHSSYDVDLEAELKNTKKCCRYKCKEKRDRSTYVNNPGKVAETQTSKTRMDDKDLLTEVLTVFQTKRTEPIRRNCTLNSDCKPASFQAANDVKRKINTLSVSKLVKYSINENDTRNSGFMIIDSHQPDKHKSTTSSIRLFRKDKSSSIPQMKLEELKYSLKEKSKPLNDTVQEVNRMFAIVGKFEKSSKDDLNNRPITRSGPRILPVVNTESPRLKTKELVDNFSIVSNQKTPQENLRGKKDNYSEISESRRLIQSGKMCQTNDYYMSGGDSKESCSDVLVEKNCRKLVYALPCYHNGSNQQCECCSRRRNSCKCCKECSK
ncbi:hypothetical protein O0L34_g13461 [Tuta absoluta]|nr:hypothetical protein O0L34_g13461 [Tuta absoluta]